jgi:hypothetical protein
MKELHYFNDADNKTIEQAWKSGVAGDVVMINPPDLILVQMSRHKDTQHWDEHLKKFPYKKNICPPNDSGKKEEIVVALGWLQSSQAPDWARVKFGDLLFKFDVHSVEVAHSQTVWKTQGQSFERAIMDLASGFGAKKLTLEMLYVMITRVKSMESIRCLPLQDINSMIQILLDLRPSYSATKFRCFAEQMAMSRRQMALLNVRKLLREECQCASGANWVSSNSVHKVCS